MRAITANGNNTNSDRMDTYEKCINLVLGRLQGEQLKCQVALFDNSANHDIDMSPEACASYIQQYLAVKPRMKDGENGFFNIGNCTKVNCKRTVYKDIMNLLKSEAGMSKKVIDDLESVFAVTTGRYTPERLLSLKKMFSDNLYHLLLPSDLHELQAMCKDSENKASTDTLIVVIKMIKETNEKYAVDESVDNIEITPYTTKRKRNSQHLSGKEPTSPGKDEIFCVNCCHSLIRVVIDGKKTINCFFSFFSLLTDVSYSLVATKRPRHLPVVSPGESKTNTCSNGGKSKTYKNAWTNALKDLDTSKNSPGKHSGDRIVIHTSMPVQVAKSGSVRFALFFHGLHDTQRGKESFWIKCTAIRRAFLIAQKMGDENAFGTHKYMKQVLETTTFAYLRAKKGKIEEDEPYFTDDNKSWPHRILCGIIEINKNDCDDIDREIDSVVKCLSGIFRHKNYFKYYHQGMYWELCEKSSDLAELLTSFVEITDSNGGTEEGFLHFLNGQLKKKPLGKSVVMRPNFQFNKLSYDQEGCYPTFFKMKDLKTHRPTIKTIPINHVKDEGLIDIVPNFEVMNIGSMLYGQYHSAFKEIVFGQCDNIANKDDSFLTT